MGVMFQSSNTPKFTAMPQHHQTATSRTQLAKQSVLQEVFNISTDIMGMWLKDNCINVCVMLIVSRSLDMISNVGPAMNYRNGNIITIFAQWVRKGKARIPSWCFHCLLLASVKFKDRDYENKGRRDGLFTSSPLAGPGSETGLCFHLVSQEADFISLLLCFWNKGQ